MFKAYKGRVRRAKLFLKRWPYLRAFWPLAIVDNRICWIKRGRRIDSTPSECYYDYTSSKMRLVTDPIGNCTGCGDFGILCFSEPHKRGHLCYRCAYVEMSERCRSVEKDNGILVWSLGSLKTSVDKEGENA